MRKVKKRTWAKPKRRMSISLKDNHAKLADRYPHALQKHHRLHNERKQVALIIDSHGAKLMLLYEISVTKRKKS